MYCNVLINIEKLKKKQNIKNFKEEKSIETSTIPGLIYNVKEYQKICNHV